MCAHPFAKEALTLRLARSEGHERYFGCNLMHHNVLASSYQHLIAEAPFDPTVGGERQRPPELWQDDALDHHRLFLGFRPRFGLGLRFRLGLRLGFRRLVKILERPAGKQFAPFQRPA